MSRTLAEVVGFLDGSLEIERFRDYAPNGLQVEGNAEVKTVVTGVSASAQLLDRAVELAADLVVVHHGLIWGGGLAAITGPTAARLRTLLGHRISLAAYHLPLDKHPRLGNNAGLADAIGVGADRTWFGDVRGVALGLRGGFATPLSREAAIQRIGAGVLGGADPRFVFPFGPSQVKTVGLCTGAASDLLEAASRAGCDLYVTGELAERAGELARELGVTLVAAGHVATEVFGVQRLAAELRATFPDLSVEYIDVPSPL